MAGIWLGPKFWSRRIKRDLRPYRTALKSGRKGCLGDDTDPYPGTFHSANCNGKPYNLGVGQTQDAPTANPGDGNPELLK